jgi:hypothetical protein
VIEGMTTKRAAVVAASLVLGAGASLAVGACGEDRDGSVEVEEGTTGGTGTTGGATTGGATTGGETGTGTTGTGSTTGTTP